MDTLDDVEWERTIVVIDRLATLGSSARMPLSKSLGDGLFELRFTLGSTARRITYRFTRDGRIILLTTFRKQRNNERNEIVRARRAAEACAEQYPCRRRGLWRPTPAGKTSRRSAPHPMPTPAPGWSKTRSDEHTSELQSLMRLSYADFRLNKQIE